MPLLPLHGHAALRARLDDAIRRDALPSSLLLHGPVGVGKQRLALWLGQRLLCTGDDPRPCGVCQHCRYALVGTHPDLHWFFPRPRLKDAEPSLQQVSEDFREAVAERLESGAYPPSPPEQGILIATIRALVALAALTPSLGSHKIFVVGDADRLVMRDGSEEAAGAFLKVLEEPPPRTTLVLTSSEPGALIPTIRSRVVALRVPPLGGRELDAVLAEPAMQSAIAATGLPSSPASRRRLANGAPGALLASAEWGDALERARQLIDVALAGERAEQMRAALAQGGSRARGAFTTALEALTTLLHERMRAAADRGDEAGAASAARAFDLVERAKDRATANVNPQLLTIELIRQLERSLR